MLKSQWHATATSEPIWVQSAEITGTKWGFNDANNVGWAQAARAAAAMCYNRGFVGGHFDGHQDVAAGAYGIQCSGTGATYYDVSRSPWMANGHFQMLTLFHGHRQTARRNGFPPPKTRVSWVGISTATWRLQLVSCLQAMVSSATRTGRNGLTLGCRTRSNRVRVCHA